MTTYSVADAKAGLSRLIDRAMAGEEVIITRRRKPVAELRPAPTALRAATRASHDWFLSRRVTPTGEAPTSVELLNLIYDEPGV